MENSPGPALTPELLCSDISESLAFYTQILGFQILYQRAEDGFAMLERQGSRLMLEQNKASCRTWISGPLEHPFGRGINFQIQTTNVDTLYAQVLRSSAVVFLRLEEKWYRSNKIFLGNRQFIVLDPDGYMLRFFQDLGIRPVADDL